MEKKSGILGIPREAPLVLSALLFTVVFLFYSLRVDMFSAATWLPPWVWLCPGFLLTFLGMSRRARRHGLALVLLWLVFLAIFAEEPRSLLRFRTVSASQWEKARNQGRALRIISLNCEGGSKDAAEEIVPWQPDIVLLQESPSQSDLDQLARRLFGESAGILKSVDPAILLRGTIVDRERPSARNDVFLQAHVALASGLQLEVISLRLHPPQLRADLWSPGCWRDHAEDRRERRENLKFIMGRISALPPGTPVIAGGDFNVPSGDGVFRILRPRLHDTFLEGGQGWGNTALNEFPVSRVDQIWASDRFRSVSVIAVKTRHSDHRMVVSDLMLAD